MDCTTFDKKIMDAKSAQDEAAVIQPQIVKNARELAIYVVFGAGTSSGAVVIEASHDPEYSGTWANLATVNWAAATKVHEVSVTGVHKAVRMRISTVIAGGTVDGWAVAN